MNTYYVWCVSEQDSFIHLDQISKGELWARNNAVLNAY